MKKSIITILVGIIALLGGYSTSQTFGSDNTSSLRVDVYGSISATTTATTTQKVIEISPDYNKINLNIKASSTAAQSITVYPEFSNENNCDTASTWFRETNNAVSGAAVTVSTSTYSVGIGSGYSYNSLVIDEINARCLRLNINTSSTTVPALVWAEGYLKN
jgi:hypothetical protein